MTKETFNEEEFPREGEVVIVKVTKILNYGCFCNLLEYENITGFVHVNNVAPGWVKNIRKHVKEQQIRAAKVLSVNKAKREVELSFAKVSKNEEKKYLAEWQKFVRAKKILEIYAKSIKKDFNYVWKNIAEKLVAKYGNLYDALQTIAIKGKEAVPSGIKSSEANKLLEIVSKNISVREREIREHLLLHSLANDGLLRIKNFFKDLSEIIEKNNIDVSYAAAGKWLVIVKALDYKAAEQKLREFNENAEKLAKKYSLNVGFERIKE